MITIYVLYTALILFKFENKGIILKMHLREFIDTFMGVEHTLKGVRRLPILNINHLYRSITHPYGSTKKPPSGSFS